MATKADRGTGLSGESVATLPRTHTVGTKESAQEARTQKGSRRTGNVQRVWAASGVLFLQ